MEEIRIMVNGMEVMTSPDKTILEAVHKSKLDSIPTLCHDKRLEHFTSCFLCVVEVEGINKLVPSCSTKVTDGMKIHTRSGNVIETRKMALELLMSNHYADCIGPCSNNCPAGVDAQTYIALISMGKYKEALKLVKENNPLPLSIGRVCVRDCEAACRRKYIDEPVAVNTLKRFIADIDNVSKWAPEVKPGNNKKIAVIGGGPSGLSCAYYLRLEGYQVTIFEKLPKLGGMLRYGIPEYRLPKHILDSEIEWILSLGIDTKTEVVLGQDFSIKSLFSKGYEAVFLGVGAHKASKLGLDGEDKIPGIFRGIDFLREVELNTVPEFLGTVIVVGGGNTAIDTARTAIRCGADHVKIVYRRSLKEMPARAEEIEAAVKEGVEINFLTNPRSIVTENNCLKGIECLKMQLEEGQPGERPKPVALPGSEFIIECDYLIGAIGQAVDTSFTNFDTDCTLEKWGTLSVNNDTLETKLPGVFAGGDVVTGPLTAITSIAQGKKAALSIKSYLETGKASVSNGKFYSFKHKLSTLSEREFEHFDKLPREKMFELPVTERISNFREVELGITERQTKSEVLRCLECGCQEYSDCRLRKYCDEYHINISEFKGETKKYSTDRRHPFIALDPNKCINCGRCVRTCAEILKVSALGFVYRGFKSVVKPAMEKPLSETNCISCGNCVDACPTGAISEKFPYKVLGTLPKESIETICSFCSVGCKINFKKITNDLFYVSNTTEEVKDSHNRGYLCIKGRFGYRYLLSKNRILNPVIKRNGLTHNVKLEEALLYTEKKIKSIIFEYGNDSVAVLASPKLSCEELYLLQKFVRTGLKNNNIASFSNLVYGIEQDSLDEMLGFTTSTVTTDGFNRADVIVVMNSNLSDENLVMELKIKEAQKKGAKLVLISSSEIKLSRHADIWIDSKKGTNTFLWNSIIKYFIDHSLTDQEFISSRTNESGVLADQYEPFSLEKAAGFSAIDIKKLRSFVSLISNPDKNIVFVYNIDSTTDKSVNDLKAIGNFLLSTGRIGKADNGVIILREFNNSAGLLEMGISPDYLPGYVKQGQSTEINEIGKLWNTSLTNIFKPVDLARKMKRGDIKGLLIFGEDPLMVRENARYFNNLELLVVSDAFHSNSADEADVILPASTHIEQSGSYINCDNAIQRTKRITESSNDMDNWQIIARLASFFSREFKFNSPEEVYNEIRQVNRFMRNSQNDDLRFTEYFYNGFLSEKLSFLKYPVDFSTFDPVKSIIHFPENYYLYNVRNKLV